MAVRLTEPGRRSFVGRTRELAAAAEILADTERAGVALIGGESGLGKTRLVEEIILGSPRNTLVVRGVAVPRSAPVPFELVRSALDPLLLERGEGQHPAHDPEPPVPYDSMADWEVIAAGRVRTEAEELRALDNGSTIFVFEDVHWADPESLAVIDRLLVAGPLGSSVLITYRTNALHPDHPTSSFLQRAERRSHVVQFRLEPLRREEVQEYLVSAGRTVSPATVDYVHGRTGGNPLMLSELVAATTDDADLKAGLPWTLAEMLRPEIDRLPAAERLVAEAVAVLGTAVDFDLLAAAVTVAEDELLERLRALVGGGILLECGPDRFGFRHDMVREAVADSLFAREHRRIHAAVHDALLATKSEDVVSLVAHATGAGRTKQAADAARDAAREALDEGRTHQAVSFAEQALLEHGDDIDLIRIAVIAGWMTAQYRTASHHLDRWEELVGANSPESAEILHYRVRVLWEHFDTDGADRTAEKLAALIETLEPGVAMVQALADVSQHHMLRDRAAEAIVAADRALEVAALVGPAADGAVLQARAERASAVLCEDLRNDDAVREMLAVADEAAATDDHLLASRALHNVPIQHPLIDPRPHIERMRREGLCAGISSLTTDSYRRSLLSVSEMEGDGESFAALMESAVDDLHDETEVALLAAFFALDLGDIPEARRWVDQMPDHLDGQRVAAREYATGLQRGASAVIDLLEGDAEPVRQWLRHVIDDEGCSKFSVSVIHRYLSSLLDAGLHDEVRAFTGHDRFVDSNQPLHDGIRAEVAGDHQAASDHYASALDDGTRYSVIDESEIHLALARTAAALGTDQRPHLEAAATRLARWPGRRLTYVESLLGAPSPTEPSGGLTPREREVALLVSRGLTNGGIADELFISTKTASVHVSNILAKLTMTSRTEIAEWVVDGGLG